ncbi:MAG: hypothetical protein F9K25_09195 [Candidatus Contendobacter sp.]|nr:MAG: hypothetical protein F9K25_09195 [Candidatus Contendobacter sp.]
MAYLDAVGLINSVSRKFIVRMEKTRLGLARMGSGQKIRQLLSDQQAVAFRETPVVAGYCETVLGSREENASAAADEASMLQAGIEPACNGNQG